MLQLTPTTEKYQQVILSVSQFYNQQHYHQVTINNRSNSADSPLCSPEAAVEANTRTHTKSAAEVLKALLAHTTPSFKVPMQTDIERKSPSKTDRVLFD